MTSNDLAIQLQSARESVWRASQRLSCFPNVVVTINANYAFWMDHEEHHYYVADGYYHDGYISPKEWAHRWDKPILQCALPDALLCDILDRKVNWNNAEIGCLIRFNRTGPYQPDVHTLMSFFHLPREAT